MILLFVMNNLRTCAPVLARVQACDTQAHMNVNRHKHTSHRMRAAQ